MKIGIHYGVLFPTIDEQMRQQGFKPKSVTNVLHHEKLRDAINLLRMSSTITEADSERAFRRLHKRVIKNVNTGE